MDRKLEANNTVQDKGLIDRMMMLRFRPIAPKPAPGDPDSGGCEVGNKTLLLSGMRTKRKYVRVRRNNKNNNNNNKNNGHKNGKRKELVEKTIVTLQLLPDKADEGSSKADKEGDKNQWLFSFSSPSTSCPVTVREERNADPSIGDLSAWIFCTNYLSSPLDRSVSAREFVESRVIMETFTTCSCTGEEPGLGCTDSERVTTLGSSTCPGFLSNPSGKVMWVNRAYGAMVLNQLKVVGFGTVTRPEMAVRLVMKAGQPVQQWGSVFTCRVKIQNTWRDERWSQTVPCDVWRMDSGGLAWRLDLEAALSLGS